MAPPEQPHIPAILRLRTALAVLYLFSAAGLIAELLLTRHTEDFWQKLPIFLLVAGMVAIVPTFISSSRIVLALFQMVLVLQIISAAAGIYFHHAAREEFQLEAYPDLAGWELFMEAVSQRNPPPLAPGAMAMTGLIGLAWSYRHSAALKTTQTANTQPTVQQA